MRDAIKHATVMREVIREALREASWEAIFTRHLHTW